MKRKMKIVSLCTAFPRISRSQHILDPLAKQTFKLDMPTPYIHSNAELQELYGFGLKDKFIGYRNDFIPDFDSFGSNEQYIINNIYFSEFHLHFLVGGIGTGKSRFLQFFRNEVLKHRRHPCDAPCDFRDRVMCAYIDFNSQPNDWLTTHHQARIENSITRLLCSKIEKIIKNFFDTEQEVTDVWDHLFQHDDYKNNAVDLLIGELRAHEALEWKAGFNLVKEKRMRIYHKLRDSKEDYLAYLSVILNYIKTTFFRDNRICINIIFDNLDLLPNLVQIIAKEKIKILFNTASVTGIVAVRQSTYRELITNGYSFSANVIPHNGPSIFDIVHQRLDLLLANPDAYMHGLDIDQSDKRTFIDSIKQIKKLLQESKLVMNFYRSICGRSIRKALILSERLICNSVYDVFSNSPIGQGEILRAIMAGSNSTYVWDEENEIANLYDVNGRTEHQHLIKLRILKAVYFHDDLELGKLMDLLTAFGYDYELIQYALNDLLSVSKRLLWTDSLLHFKSVDELLQQKKSKLSMSSAGKGYATWLYKNISYVQEVMLDIPVDADDFGEGWNYANIDQRIKLILKFLAILVRDDIAEMNTFYSTYDVNTYKDIWKFTDPITTSIVIGVESDFNKIMANISSHKFGATELQIIRSELSAQFENLKNMAAGRVVE
ncbi:hypothetical protein JW960_20395 [candidate division KSB1 bacterium]|nr:hypothetical protein [candidate division KSB1 bacterium]